MNITVTLETRFCSIETLRKQSLEADFRKGDKLKVIFPKKLTNELYGNICYYLACCILSGWQNPNAELALDSCLNRAKIELRNKGVKI